MFHVRVQLGPYCSVLHSKYLVLLCFVYLANRTPFDIDAGATLMIELDVTFRSKLSVLWQNTCPNQYEEV